MNRTIALLACLLLCGCTVQPKDGDHPAPVSSDLLGSAAYAEYAALADGFEDLAERIDRGEIKTVDELHAEMKAMGDSVRAEAREPLARAMKAAFVESQDVKGASRWLKETAREYRR